MISATWWTNSTIYIPEYSQYWFQHAVLNLITTRREFTLLLYSTTLSSLITSFCIIFDICNILNYRSIYIPEYSQYWFQHAVLNLITTRREFTLLQNSTTLSSIIASFRIIFDICNILNYRSIYIPEYSQISTRRIEFNHYKREFTLLLYSTTLSSIIASFFIIFDICYMMNQQYYIYSRILPVLISTCRIEFNHYKREFTLLLYSTTLSSLITSFCIIFDICNILNYRSIYIPEYSQYWFQHAVLNLITTRREFTLLQYSTTLSSIIASFFIIFDICYMMNQQYYIYSRILPVLISTCRIEFNHYKREFTLLLYSTTLSSIIASFFIIFDICYMMNQQYYIYSRTLPVLISTCRIEFNHYKREFTLLLYSTTLSSLITSFCIIFDICNILNYRSIYIPEYSQYWFQHAVLNLITTRREFTLLQYSTTLSSIIASFCIIFDKCYMMNQQYIYILVYSQYWYQHAVINLFTTRREFTLLQYSTTLSSIIASFFIIFDICYMMNQHNYIYSRTLPVLISTCRIEFNHYKREFTLLLYSTTLSSIIASFCIIFDICYMSNLPFYIYSWILPVLISKCCIEFNHYKTWIYSITVFHCTFKYNNIILYRIWYLLHVNLPFYIYSWILPVLISTCCIEFNHYKTWIYSITVFYNTLKHNRIILYHIWYLLHDEPTVLYIFQNTPSIDFNMPYWI